MAAEHGLADARYFLGQALESGDGVESNLQEAIDWYFVASEQGHASGRRRFWSLCISGAFRPETYEETIFAELIGVHLGNSIPFFRDALRLRKGWEVEIYSKICRASRGDATSQFELGNQYHIGDKVLMDFDAAIYWYKLASEQNYPFAWNNLGIIYNIPQEIYFDEVEAASCFRKASELGYFNQMTAWIQTSSATVDLKAWISSAMASAGVLHPSVFLGRLFINAATSLSHVWLALLRSLPFGMY